MQLLILKISEKTCESYLKQIGLKFLYPFVIVGPSLLFIGLSLHALNFIKTNVISFLMVFLSSLAIGFSFFILKNGVYMLLSCVIFVLGLAFLLNRKENQNEQFDK